ncbi:MoxR-like ATPase [Streptomyces sp. B3I7]|uniref:AAA family ATPase n=1 Tax=Streptomyces sp. B3I7 TaxID=3042269 RepID=UPI0027888614|nr:MoxR family ATPase [Streptomyces sp. B3I7]MDQ0809182.1 MoxR-like ATPase [Streptomyces sp. B3I7]
MGYVKLFDPDEELTGTPHPDPLPPLPPRGVARPDDEVYLFDDRTVLAVNIALATGRPLLVLGPPGSGKSTLAPNVARLMGLRYYAEVVTARTEPHDLLWREEAFRQLNDAYSGRLGAPDSPAYFRPGVLWKALDPSVDPVFADSADPAGSAAGEAVGAGADPALRGRPAVVLIDEIDKADPDVPDALLDPLNNLRFEGPGRRLVTAAEGIGAPLVVITSNEERELSAAFRRRCIPLVLEPPDREHLLRVAQLHMGAAYDPLLASELAEMFDAESSAARPVASTAEFLDTLRACRQMGLTADSPEWRAVAGLAMVKGSTDVLPYA